jgi:hypothetical protein
MASRPLAMSSLPSVTGSQATACALRIVLALASDSESSLLLFGFSRPEFYDNMAHSFLLQGSLAILVVGDLFHPVDDFTVERFLNGDMRHSCCWSCAMPMLLARRKPEHIAGMNFFNRTAIALHPSATGYDN